MCCCQHVLDVVSAAWRLDCALLSLFVFFDGFLRKDWFIVERVDTLRGEALEKVDGGVLGIFLPR